MQTACEQRHVWYKNRTEEEKRWCFSSSPPVGCGLPAAVWCVKVCPRWRFKKMGWTGKWDHYTCLEDLVATHTTWLLPAGGNDSQYLVCVCVHLCEEGRNSSACVQTPAVSVCLSPTFSSIRCGSVSLNWIHVRIYAWSISSNHHQNNLLLAQWLACICPIIKRMELTDNKHFWWPIHLFSFIKPKYKPFSSSIFLNARIIFVFDHSKLNMFVCWSQFYGILFSEQLIHLEKKMNWMN